MRTASTDLLDALTEAKVDYIFANFGSDHPALIEAIAIYRNEGRPLPQIITCPFEMVGLAAAHGHTMVSGRAQAVVVHVECGTQSLAGAVHNAARARIPVLIFAGLSPATQDGEARGSRNEFIQWIQDIHDQRSIVREYMKYAAELRSGLNVKQMVHRALQFALSEPRGPVYLMGTREVMEQEVQPVALDMRQWGPVEAAALPESGVATVIQALEGAQRPLIVTSYLGRNPEAVAGLTRLCQRLGVGVLESVPSTLNFPHSDPLYQGSHWNHPFQNEALAEADVVLVIDSDVPWIPTISRPREDARILHIDVDPLKQSMPLWYIKAEHSYRADAATALAQINAELDRRGVDARRAEQRRTHYAGKHAARAARIREREAAPATGEVTVEHLMACLRPHLAQEGILLSEGITNYPQVIDHLAPTRPGSYFASGGGSLGWNGGAAIGAKLAAPDQTVVSVSGDGCYMFSVPSSVHWMARRYDTPFLQVVLNNGGWQAPRFSALSVHPSGHASRAANLDLSFDPPPDYGAVAAASGGALALRVERAAEVPAVLEQALEAVRKQRRCVVLDVVLKKR
ncbi:MAG: thiamine pyrophosphate-requiring protein [Steroidobacteraceae bacterium]